MTVDEEPVVDVGEVCSTCGLSEVGARRLLANGFDPHPCVRCPLAVGRAAEGGVG